MPLMSSALIPCSRTRRPAAVISTAVPRQVTRSPPTLTTRTVRRPIRRRPRLLQLGVGQGIHCLSGSKPPSQRGHTIASSRTHNGCRVSRPQWGHVVGASRSHGYNVSLSGPRWAAARSPLSCSRRASSSLAAGYVTVAERVRRKDKRRARKSPRDASGKRREASLIARRPDCGSPSPKASRSVQQASSDTRSCCHCARRFLSAQEHLG